MKKIMCILLVLSVSFSMFANGEQEKPVVSDDEVVFIRNNGTEPQSLDPGHIEGVPEHNIYMCIFEGLVTYDPKTLEAIPAVAESWDISEDQLTYTFHLRKDAKWSDGVPITAQTVVDSWLRFLSPELAAAYAYLPGMIVKGALEYNSGTAGPESVAIRALDEHTFQFELVGPAPYALNMLPHYAFGIVPMHAIEKYGDAWIRPENFVGNGPFTVETWSPHDKLVMVKNDAYWDADNVKLDKVIFYPIEDVNTSVNMFIQGDIDWIENVPDAQLEKMQLRDDYNVNPAFTTGYYIFNFTNPVLKDVRVRKAMCMAIDRQQMVDRVLRGGQFPAYGITPPLPRYEAVVGFDENIKEARQLLAEAGYPDGKGFPEMCILYNTNEGNKKLAEYIQQQWAENLHLNITIENQEWATFIDNRQAQQFDIGRAAWQGDYVDPNTFLQDLLHSQSGNNDGLYNNAEFDALLNKATLMPDGQERFDTLRRAEEIAFQEDFALVPLYYYTRSNWIDLNKWGGWYMNTLDIHPYKFIYKK